MIEPSERARRYLDGEGRLFLWPAQEEARREVAKWLAAVLIEGRPYSEQEVSQLLAECAVSPDPSFLRRELVDRGLWSRDRAGRRYHIMNSWQTTTGSENVNVHRNVDAAGFTLVGRPDCRPHLHPVTTPSGVVVTEDAPPHHPWQHGIYVGLNGVNGVGFWKEFDEDGRIVVQSLTASEAGGEAISHYVTPAGDVLLVESQRWQARDWAGGYAIDFEWTLQALVDVTFGEYEYGGLFLRMPFRDELGGEVQTSEGEVRDGIRAEWVSVTMPLGSPDTLGTVAILSSPSNPVRPMPWRIDGQLGIGPARCAAGAWQLAPQSTATERYRILVADGKIDASTLATAFLEFTK